MSLTLRSADRCDSVTNYSITTGLLTLEHDCPRGTRTKACVDVMLLRSTLHSTDTAIGEWVNVMGYVTKCPEHPEIIRQEIKSNMILINAKSPNPTAFSKKSLKDDLFPAKVYLQAIVLWSAKGIKLQEYEITMAKALADFRKK